MRGHLVLEQSISKIKRGHQYRKDPGDLEPLCESITRTGLLNPPAITEGLVLITGNRRLAAMELLGHRVTPVWVVPGVSDALSYILAVRDEQTLHQALKPTEQAELYEELKALYAEDAARRQAATQFPLQTSGGIGGADVAPPTDTNRNERRSRVKAAKAVTGRDSRTKLEEVSELQRIAASPAEDPMVRQAAAEALIGLNEDGKVHPRYKAVKTRQHLTTLQQHAHNPALPDHIRESANKELASLENLTAESDPVKETGLAVERVQELAAATETGWKDIDPLLREKHHNHKLTTLLRREYGWWDTYNSADFGEHATEEQWSLLTTYVAQASTFCVEATTRRKKADPAPVS